MIVVESSLKNIFATLPAEVENGKEFKPVYDFGNQKELLCFINSQNKLGATKYPLIWLETPVSMTGKPNQKEVNLTLVLATLSKYELSNTQRLETTFKNTLFPLLENVLKALKRSGKTRIKDEGNIKTTNYFNYGVKDLRQKNESQVSNDIWDAIKLECKIEITANCGCDIKINY